MARAVAAEARMTDAGGLIAHAPTMCRVLEFRSGTPMASDFGFAPTTVCDVRSGTLSCPSSLIDLPDRYGGRASGNQKKIRRHIVELDPHGHALRQAHPAESRIDRSQQVAAGAAVLVLDPVGDTLDVSRQDARIADQFYGRIVADVDALQFGFLEIALDAERVGADQCEDSRAGVDVAPRQEIEIGDDAVDGCNDRRALEVEHRDLERRVGRVEAGLIDVDRLLSLFDLLDGDRGTTESLAAIEIALGLVERDLTAGDVGLRLIERILEAPLVDAEQLLAFGHFVIVVNKDVADQAGNTGDDRHDVCANPHVARPRPDRAVLIT